MLLKNTSHNGIINFASTKLSADTPAVSATNQHPIKLPNIINNILGISFHDCIYPIFPVYKLKLNNTIDISPTANKHAANRPPPNLT